MTEIYWPSRRTWIASVAISLGIFVDIKPVYAGGARVNRGSVDMFSKALWALGRALAPTVAAYLLFARHRAYLLFA